MNHQSVHITYFNRHISKQFGGALKHFFKLKIFFLQTLDLNSVQVMLSECDSLMVSALAYHAADPGSNPAQGDVFFN